MEKKVTRRIALGTVAAGLGSLAVAPYIIRSLKGKYHAKDAGGRYDNEWSDVVKKFDVPIKEIDGRSDVTLDFKPQVGSRYRVINLFTDYKEFNSDMGYPKSPDMYFFAEGTIAGIPPIVDNLPALALNEKISRTLSRSRFANEPIGDYILVARNGECSFYESKTRVPRRIPVRNASLSCILIGDSLTFPYPVGKNIVKGMKWSIPETYLYNMELPCEIVGYANVAGRDTVKMVAEKQLNNREFQSRIAIEIQHEKKMNDEAGRPFNVDEELPKRRQAAVKSGETFEIQINAYVDLETGLVMRFEAWTKRHSQEPNFDSLGLWMNQVLDG